MSGIDLDLGSLQIIVHLLMIPTVLRYRLHCFTDDVSGASDEVATSKGK